MKYNLINDVANLTALKPVVLNKIVSLEEYCICDYVSNLDILDDDTVEIDLGFGTLSIQVLDDEINYYFKPSTKFEKALAETVLDEGNPLVHAAETSLEKKFYSTYKDLI